MDQVTLRAAPRLEKGTRPSRRLRREDRIPAVVYGRGIDPMPVTVGKRDLFAALRTEAGLNALINVEVEGRDAVLTVAREVQRHPVRGDITHLDLIKVSLDVAIQAEVGVEYQGVPLAVREEGAIVETLETSVMIEALPNEVPSSIEVDIAHLSVGDTLTLGDLPALEGVTYVDEPDRPLLTVLIPRVIEEEPVVELDEFGEPIVAPAELEEGEEAEEGEAGSEDEG